MKPVTPEFRDEVLASLLCWKMYFALGGTNHDTTLIWYFEATIFVPAAVFECVGRLFGAGDVSDAKVERAIATVERWPVLP